MRGERESKKAGTGWAVLKILRCGNKERDVWSNIGQVGLYKGSGP